VKIIGGSALCALTLWLCSNVALATDPIFMGRWSIDPAGCIGFGGQTAQTTALVVGGRSVEWFQSSCTIKKSCRIANGLYLEANCFGQGRSRVMPIGLQLNGSKLRVTWDQTVAGDMQRCR
jgi:hypothetical protein